MMNHTPLSAWHRELATAWAHYNGQKGTEKQLAKIAGQLTTLDLERMLAERGYQIVELAANVAKGV